MTHTTHATSARPPTSGHRLARCRRWARTRALSLATASAAVVRTTMPPKLRRLMRHDFVLSASLLRWLARRRPHGVRDGDTAVAYAGAQSAALYGMLFVCLVETVALAYLIPWPLVHRIVLVIDVYGIVFVLGLHAACVMRPHVIGADGSLRLRYGPLVDIHIPADRISSARLHLRSPTGRLVEIGDDQTADLVVGGQTTLTVELTEPVSFLRPLGSPTSARTLRFYADDPRSALVALAALVTVKTAEAER
ncbi:hypothetical protein [Streptomyces zagrosensis]|uniref:Uncharacterized protein n=1 Tax=Streptomyces zagrosensis TaxID=1042984 RepID=A0A7W9QAG5_9ACTN|nr:hypothetical protein [Streptomyces zagrosensis]MBB5936546.1 hypothetical protein [Streptomyces zagrosensis]